MALHVKRHPSPLPSGASACLGAFDGLHRGHQALLDRARAHGSPLAVVTFDPHPMQVLAPDRAPRLLHTPLQRERILSALGVEILVLLPFDRDMSSLSPEAFTRRYLVEGLRPATVVVGQDFRFGAQRAGDAPTLRELLAPAGIEVDIVEPVPLPGSETDGGPKLSSTNIRHALDEGNVERAAELLGRWHTVAGDVVEGAKRGRTIGFPTANVACPGAYLPPAGVYATMLVVWDRRSPHYGQAWPSVANLGHNPTFTAEDAPLGLEVHVLDRDLGDSLYGMAVEVAFVHRLRSERKFVGPDALIAQIERDIEEARVHLTPDVARRLVVPLNS